MADREKTDNSKGEKPMEARKLAKKLMRLERKFEKSASPIARSRIMKAALATEKKIAEIGR